MKLYLVEYENLTFGEGNKEVNTIVLLDSDNNVGQAICEEFHKYEGNQLDGHGKFTANVQQISRKRDVDIKEHIEELMEKTAAINKQIAYLCTQLETPYNEIGEPFIIKS